MFQGLWRVRRLMLFIFPVLLCGCGTIGAPLGSRLAWFRRPVNVAPTPSFEPVEPKPFQPEQKAEIQVAMARGLEQQGRTEDACKVYLEALENVPNHAEACHRLALLYNAKGDFQAAEVYYLRAIGGDSQNAGLHCDLGYHYYLQKRWPEAEASLCRALSLSPDLARAHNNLALVLAQTGREQDALQEFLRAGCRPAESYANLGFALSLAGRWNEAERQYRLALDLDPKCPQAQRGMMTLRSLAHRGQALAQPAVPGQPGFENIPTAYLDGTSLPPRTR